MDFTQSMDNGYMIPTSVAVGSGEAADIRCVCDTVEDFKTFLDANEMDLRYEGLITYEKANKLLKVYKGNNEWQVVGAGGGGVDTSSFITLTQLSQQLSNYYTKEQVDKKISDIVIESGNISFRDIEDGEIFEIEGSETVSPPPSQPAITYGNIIISTSSLSVNEGGTTNFTVKLDKAPTNNQTVNISVNNDYCTLDKASLTFEPNNYSVAQTVTINGIHDSANYSDKSSIINVSSANVSNKTISVTIKNIDENDTAETIDFINLLYKSDTFESPAGYATYWQAYKGTKELVSAGHVKFTHNNEEVDGIFKCIVGRYMIDVQGLNKNHKYYMKHKYSEDGTSYTLNSFITEKLETFTNLFNYTEIDGGKSLYVKDCIVIDLTQKYGEGNEPSVSECNAIFGDLWHA